MNELSHGGPQQQQQCTSPNAGAAVRRPAQRPHRPTQQEVAGAKQVCVHVHTCCYCPTAQTNTRLAHTLGTRQRNTPTQHTTLSACRLQHLALSRNVSVSPSQLGGIRWMDLDPVEQRFLLTAAADSTLEAFDVMVSMSPGEGGGTRAGSLRRLSAGSS